VSFLSLFSSAFIFGPEGKILLFLSFKRVYHWTGGDSWYRRVWGFPPPLSHYLWSFRSFLTRFFDLPALPPNCCRTFLGFLRHANRACPPLTSSLPGQTLSLFDPLFFFVSGSELVKSMPRDFSLFSFFHRYLGLS